MPDISKISDIDTYHDVNDEFELGNEISAEGANSFHLRRKDGFIIEFNASDQKFEFSCWFDGHATGHSITVASALIVSELVNGVWKRSTSHLNVGKTDAIKKVFSFDQWASLYAPKQIVSSKYLNNGAEKTGINS